MKQYLDLLSHVLEHGSKKTDRTGTGTLSVFGYQMRFDLSQGFPLVTTKKTWFKGVKYELLWFLRGDTNIKWLNDNKIFFWDHWANDKGDLGPVYGAQLREKEHLYWVEPKIFAPPSDLAIETPFSKEINVDTTIQNTSLLGTEIKTEHGLCTVIKELPPSQENSRTEFVVKFHNTGSERKATYTSVQNGTVEDYWAPTVCGVGAYGNFNQNDPEYEILVKTWRDMLKRCHDTTSKSYQSYGAKGIHVEKGWLVFANFQRDAKSLPGWTLKKEYPSEYSLDKDVLSASNRYSRTTCIWASKKEQDYNKPSSTPFTARSPDGKTILFKSLGEAKRKHGLNLSAVHRCLTRKLKTHHGWSDFQYVREDDGRVLRVRYVDQLKQTICSLKHTQDSRRHLISLWNPADIPKMALPPCHGVVVQFYVANGKLSCQMYQRSADLLLGVPVNIASYALLTHMIAQVVGLEVGDFVHTFGDAHIYLNHVDLVKQQLTRSPHPLPTLWLNPEIKDIDDFKPEDIDIQNYKHDSAIIAPIAVSKDMERKIGLVVAVGENGVIGADGNLPNWKLKRDMVRFRRKTIGRPVIMGRKTHESIGMTLPDRRNIVITRQKDYVPFEGSEVAHSLEEALELCKDYPETMVIGGGEIYRMALPFVDNLYLTVVHGEFEGDVTFETKDIPWEKTWEKHFPGDENNSHDHTFMDFVRSPNPASS